MADDLPQALAQWLANFAWPLDHREPVDGDGPVVTGEPNDLQA